MDRELEQRIHDAVMDFATATRMSYGEAYACLMMALPPLPPVNLDEIYQMLEAVQANPQPKEASDGE